MNSLGGVHTQDTKIPKSSQRKFQETRCTLACGQHVPGINFILPVPLTIESLAISCFHYSQINYYVYGKLAHII